MAYLEKRRRRYMAFHDIPDDVRPAFTDRKRFSKSLGTENLSQAKIKLAEAEAEWRSDIERARGNLPPAVTDPHELWRSLRGQYIKAKDEADEGTMLAIEDAAVREALALADPADQRERYAWATAAARVPSAPTAQAAPPTLTQLEPLVAEWKATLKKAPKTVDQQHRDVARMAERIKTLESLTTQEVKKWVEEMREQGKTYATFVRVGKACRSFWAYLVDEDHRKEEDTNPFEGLFRSAQKKVTRNSTGRTGKSYTGDEVLKLYEAALAKNDQPLADVIALGAYTGARIEELCSLTKETAAGGVFRYGTKTKASKRWVPIMDSIKPLVDRLINGADKGGHLIHSTAANQYGNQSGPLSQRFGHLKTNLGFGKEYVFHTMRGTLITMLSRAGADQIAVKDIVGHRRGDFTENTYVDATLLAARVEALANARYPGALANPR